MVAQSTARRYRNTYDRWQAAERRAIDEGLVVRSDDGYRALVENPAHRTAYLVVGREGEPLSCGCPAGRAGDPVCKHLVAVDAHRAAQSPDPQPPAPPARVRRFVWVAGQGYVEVAQFAGRPAA